MIMWPYTDRLFVEPRRPPRPVYDIPPVIVGSPRWPLLRARITRLGVGAESALRRPADRGWHQR